MIEQASSIDSDLARTVSGHTNMLSREDWTLKETGRLPDGSTYSQNDSDKGPALPQGDWNRIGAHALRSVELIEKCLQEIRQAQGITKSKTFF